MAANAADAGRYSVAIKRVNRPLAKPLQTGGGHCIAVRESVLLRLSPVADATRAGYGEAATLPWFGTESAEAAFAALAALGNTLEIKQQAAWEKQHTVTAAADNSTHAPDQHNIWQDTLAQMLPPELGERLDAAPCARFALESALRQAGALPPLTLGACASAQAAQIQAARTTAAAQAAKSLPVAALLPAGTTQIPQALLDAGFYVFKTKIGVRAFEDEAASITALLRQLRQHRSAQAENASGAHTPSDITKGGANRIPSECHRLRLDANCGLPASGLHAWLRLLEPFADLIDFVEQPLHPGQEQQTALAFANSRIAFAFDESLTSLPRLREIATQFPQAVLVVKPSLLGSAEGFLRWRLQQTGSPTDTSQQARATPNDSGNAAHTHDSGNAAHTHDSGSAATFANSSGLNTGGLSTDTDAAGTQAPQRIVYSSALETGIGIAHALAVAAADHLPPEAVGFGTAALFADDGLGCAATENACIRADRPLAAQQSTTAEGLRTAMEAIWKQG